MTPGGRALVAAAGLALVRVAAGSAAAPEPALAIAVGAPLLAGSEMVVEVRQAGDLAGRQLAVQLAVDGISVGRFETNGAVTELRAPAPATPGRHEILVKSGSRRATASVRVWPRWSLAAAAGGFVALLCLGGWALRRRRAAAG